MSAVDLLRSANTWLGGIRSTKLATAVTYRRGGIEGSSFTVNATQGLTWANVEQADGSLVWSKLIDFLIEQDDLAISGTPITPQSGDQIIDGGFVYEANAIAGKPVYEEPGPGNARYRIHTKRVAVVT